MKFKISLADDWRLMHRKGTFWFSTGMATISALGPEIRETWRSLPDDLKAVIPAHAQQAIAYTILFCCFLGVRYTTIQRVRPGGDGGVQ
jgi:hypothetical protein